MSNCSRFRATGVPSTGTGRAVRQPGRKGGARNERSPRGASRRLAIVLAVLVGCAATAAADEVTSKGMVLDGKATRSLERRHHLRAGVRRRGADDRVGERRGHQDRCLVPGALRGRAGKRRAATGIERREAAGRRRHADGTQIDLTTIYAGLPIGAGGPSFGDRARSDWRYWDGSFDVGFNLQQATTDTTGLLVAFQTQRRKDPTRLTLAGELSLWDAEGEGRGSRSRSGPAARPGARRVRLHSAALRYRVRRRDLRRIQRLSLRGVPKVGAGYVLWQEDLDGGRRNFVQAEAAELGVREYSAAGERLLRRRASVRSAGDHLPYGAHFDWHMDYLPALDNFTSDYLLRSEAGLSVPLVRPINAKLGLIESTTARRRPGAVRKAHSSPWVCRSPGESRRASGGTRRRRRCFPARGRARSDSTSIQGWLSSDARGSRPAAARW